MLPLPKNSSETPWPTESWTTADPPPGTDASRLAAATNASFDPAQAQRCGKTIALLVIRGGQLVVERYGKAIDPQATQRSWSMAKSILHALVGLLVGDGALDLAAPAPEPAWQTAGDPRAAITLDDLLRMVDGLDFVESDEATGRIDVVDMIGGSGKADTAAYARSRSLVHPPGMVFNYSSGTSLIVAAIAGRAVGGGREAMERFLRARLFEPIGMRSALPRFDATGTFLGSSYVFATPRDFARFGLLYLRDGVWNDRRLLPKGWVDYARTSTPASLATYGAHWWLDVGGPDAFCAKGYQGQYIVVVPERDLVVVRLGVSSELQRAHVHETLAEIVTCFPPVSREEH